MGRYYPPNYYSYHLEAVNRRGIRAWLAGKRDYAKLTATRWFGEWLPRANSMRLDAASLARLPMRPGMKVLDVGCGRGQLLSVLHRAGFRDLWGVDPYLAADVEVLPGLVVRKQSLEALKEDFDLIMLHHVFEHLEDGRKALADCRARLRPGGMILIRIPTVDSAAWEKYRENWVDLDAPRHFFLHSYRSLALLAGQAGLAVERNWCDSTAFQFSGSEVYRAGGSLYAKTGEQVPLEGRFTPKQLAEFAQEAEVLNAAGRGDQFAAVLVHARS
jgi:SAM-dependent methyltransferase